MAKGGGGGNPSSYTGGGPSTPPEMASTVRQATPTYQNFIAGLGGNQMATPQSIAQAAMSQPPPGVAQAAPAAAAATPSNAITMDMMRAATAPGNVQSQALLGAMLGPARSSSFTDPRMELAAMLAGIGGGGGLGGSFNTTGYGWGGSGRGAGR